MPQNRSFTELPHVGEQKVVVTPVTQEIPDTRERMEAVIKFGLFGIMLIMPAGIALVIYLIGIGVVR